MNIEPFEIGVCSWSLQVRSIPELCGLLEQLGLRVVQIACGDPHHASWDEGETMPEVALQSDLRMSAAMIGFPGEDYTCPQTIRETGGFGNPQTRTERLERLQWALTRTRALGLSELTLHAGFLPEPSDPERKAFSDTLAEASRLAAEQQVILAFETGQETAELLRQTLEELQCSNLKVNFDPANMLLYDMGDPIVAVETLAPFLNSVHVKDAIRPTTPGTWGTEVPLGQGQVDIPNYLRALKRIDFRGPLCIEREVGNQAQRLADIRTGIDYLRECLAGL